MELHPEDEVLSTIVVRNLDNNQAVPLARVDELSPSKGKDKDGKGQ